MNISNGVMLKMEKSLLKSVAYSVYFNPFTLYKSIILFLIVDYIPWICL